MNKSNILRRELNSGMLYYTFIVRKNKDIIHEFQKFKTCYGYVLDHLDKSKDGCYVFYRGCVGRSMGDTITTLLVYRKDHDEIINRMIEDFYLSLNESRTRIEDDVPFYKTSGKITLRECCLDKSKFDLVFEHTINRIHSYKAGGFIELSKENLDRWNYSDSLIHRIFLGNDKCIIKEDRNGHPYLSFERNNSVEEIYCLDVLVEDK